MFRKILTKILMSPSLVGIGLTLLFAFGFVAYRGLKVDLFPPLNFPIINIITENPSYSSLEMERQVTLPIESAVGGVIGVTKVRSTSATGISMVSAEFQWGTNMIYARQLLIEALSQIRGSLPAGSEPTLENLSATLSMIEGYSLQGGTDPVKLRSQAVYELKPKLTRVPGVYKIVVMGGRIQEFAIFPNPFLMIKFDLSLDNLREALATNNILATPGTVNNFDQELVLHADGQFSNVGEIENVVVSVKNGIPVQIKDVAKVAQSYQYERGDTSERGSPSVLINIYKQPQFDTDNVAKMVASEIESFATSLPKDHTVHNYYDQAQLVNDSIGSVKESVWIGGLFVVLILFAFLHNFRTTLIAAISIPVSVIAAIVFMRLFGIGINIMSLGGLAIGTGIIVDDAIVVLENIFRWFSTPSLKQDLSEQEVIIKATQEVLRPVVVSTLTNIGIFLPMVFVEGFSGRLFQPVSFTVTFALLASLVVALSVIPLLAEKLLPKKQIHSTSGEDTALNKLYRHPLNFALRRPKVILILSIIPIVVVVLGFKALNVEFLPELDEGAILLQSIMPPGTSLGESKRMGLKLENWLKDIPGIQTVTRRTGHAPGAEDTDNVNHSDITLKLLPKNKRPVALNDFIDALKSKTSPLPSIQINYLMPLADKINDALGGVPADIGIDLFGPDLPTLHQYSEKLLAEMRSVSGLIDVRPPSDFPVPSLEINVDKKEAGRLGIAEKSIYDSIQAYSSGLIATTIRRVQNEINVTLHFTKGGENLNLENLQSLPLRTAGGSTVPLEQVAHVTFSEVPSEIYHEHSSRKLIITANIKGRNSKDIAQDIAGKISGLGLPVGYSWSFSGKYQTETNALSNMLMVFLLAILIVAIILWFEFQSVIQVALILLTIPLAAVGAVISLWVCKETLNVSSMIGAIMLVGIVVRNGIMLLDYMNSELKAGKSQIEAIHAAALKRVRPILMTASVTILGLLPIAAGLGTGSELLRPLAIAVIGGILTSTLLTLLVLPAATIIRPSH